MAGEAREWRGNESVWHRTDLVLGALVGLVASLQAWAMIGCDRRWLPCRDDPDFMRLQVVWLVAWALIAIAVFARFAQDPERAGWSAAAVAALAHSVTLAYYTIPNLREYGWPLLVAGLVILAFVAGLFMVAGWLGGLLQRSRRPTD